MLRVTGSGIDGGVWKQVVWVLDAVALAGSVAGGGCSGSFSKLKIRVVSSGGGGGGCSTGHHPSCCMAIAIHGILSSCPSIDIVVALQQKEKNEKKKFNANKLLFMFCMLVDLLQNSYIIGLLNKTLSLFCEMRHITCEVKMSYCIQVKICAFVIRNNILSNATYIKLQFNLSIEFFKIRFNLILRYSIRLHLYRIEFFRQRIHTARCTVTLLFLGNTYSEKCYLGGRIVIDK